MGCSHAACDFEPLRGHCRYRFGNSQRTVKCAGSDPQLRCDPSNAPAPPLKSTSANEVHSNGWSPNPCASPSRGKQALDRTVATEIGLELSDGRDYVKAEPSSGGAGVDSVAQADEVDVAAAKFIQGLHEMSDAAGPSIEPDHSNRMQTTSVNVDHQPVQLRPPITSTALAVIDVLADDLPASLLSNKSKLFDLRFWMLVRRRTPGVEADLCGGVPRLGVHDFWYVLGQAEMNLARIAAVAAP